METTETGPFFLIKNLAVTEGQFEDQIWKTLTSHYDNNKNIIYAHVNSFYALKKMSNESAAQLRSMINELTDSLESLRALGAPVDQWDYLLVPFILDKLDSTTRRDWEKLNSSSKEPAKFTELKTILQDRLQTLSAMEGSTSQNSSRNDSQGRKPNISNNSQNNSKVVHTVSTTNVKTNNNPKTSKSKSYKCFLCKKEHILAFCDDFRGKSTKERHDFVKVNNLCYNCLGKHSVAECRSQKTCNTCHAKHHTLIHEAVSSLAAARQSTSSSQASMSGGQNSASTAPISSHSAIIPATVRSNAVILLGTAIVEVISHNGKSSQVRALIDPCAEASFITESLTQ